ncbi:MAG: hypothetical protein CMP23_02520 [Rickettsiales bacterium]|nr:hypothetical protein [Rickettsiales bacterium]
MSTPLSRLLTLLLSLLVLLAFSPAAVAAEQSLVVQIQDEEDDDDGDDDDDDDDDGEYDDDDDGDDLDLDRDARRKRVRPSDRDDRRKTKRKRPAREVVKGAYAKINIGPLFWLGDIKGDNVSRTGTAASGTEIDFSFGYDIVDTLGFTLAVEGSFFQVITNGTGISEDANDRLGLPSVIQGDFRIFGAIAAVRAGPNLGGKRVKRLNISGHVGGGVGYSPPLVDLESPTIVGRINSEYGGILQGRPLGLVQGGVGIEYYTKLSHFSLGLDVDFNVVIGGGAPLIGMGLATNIFVKYTF